MASKIDYSRFSPQQIEAAKLLAAPYDEDNGYKRMKYGDIAAKVEVSDRTLFNWRNDPEFTDLVNDFALKGMREFIPRLFRSLKYRVDVDMSDKAIELALKHAGLLKDVVDVNATVNNDRDDKAVESEIESLTRQLSESTAKDKPES